MDNKEIQVYDNYVNPPEFAMLQKEVLSEHFPWTYNDQIIRESQKDNNFQFVHLLFTMLGQESEYFKFIVPVIQQLNPIAIHRAKFNCITRTDDIKVSGLHTDINEARMLESEPKTAILYINSNNGYTFFEDGTKVNSVANRICIFPYWMKHSSTSCTNQNRRIALNINYVR